MLLISSLLRLERQKRFLKIHFQFAYYSFFLIHLELKRQILIYTLVVPSRKPRLIPDQNKQNLCTFSDQNGGKTIPFGEAHTYMAYIRGSTLSPSSPAPKRSQNSIVSFRPHYRTFPCKITSHQAIRTKNRENSRVLWRTEVKRLNWTIAGCIL